MSSTKILIVDDEQRIRKLLRDYLIRDGYTVYEASNGRQALDIFNSEANIALIILDVMMPEMDGWQVCSEIRKTSKVPIIMLTAKSDERDGRGRICDQALQPPHAVGPCQRNSAPYSGYSGRKDT